MSITKNVCYRRVLFSVFTIAIISFATASPVWAVDLRPYHGQATFTVNGEEKTGNVLYVGSQEVRISFPNTPGVPSTFNSNQVTEIRVNNDKLTYNPTTQTYDSAAAAQAKFNGRVKLINKSKQPVTVVVTSYTNNIGEEQEIDPLDSKSATWKVQVASNDSKYFSPAGKQLMTSMLKYDVVTGDGKTHQLQSRDTSLPAGGEFEIPIEDKDLHKPKIVELVSMQFNQGDWTLDRLEGKYGNTHEKTTKSESNAANEHAAVGTGYGYGYGYGAAPNVAPGYGYGYANGYAPGYAEHDKDVHHSDKTTNEQEKNDGKSESNNFKHTSPGQA